MSVLKSPLLRPALIFIGLVVLTCSPVWSVDYFINQDGSAHVYSAYLMLELLKNNPQVHELYAFNSLSVPNSSGHWLLVLLLNFFSAYTATKIIVTLTFAGLIGSVGFLRWKVCGVNGLITSMFAGAALGFNWLWFGGFYNFLLGVIFLAMTVGFYYEWRDNLTVRRTIFLVFLITLTYLSHVVSFAVLAGSLGLLAVTTPKPNKKVAIVRTFIAFLPVIPLIILYKINSVSGAGGFYPVWRNLENPFSILSWISQIRNADPFILISRRAFPFSTTYSAYFGVFTPIIWIGGAFLLLIAPVFKNLSDSEQRNKILPFFILSGICILTALFAPDDFGLNNGSVLRERFLICGFVLGIPLFCTDGVPVLARISRIFLIFVILFQTAVLWEFAIQTDADAREFLAAGKNIESNDALMSIIVPNETKRFHSYPMSGMGNYLGIERKITAWDNYEIGHTLFPIVAKNPSDQKFVLEMAAASVALIDPESNNLPEKIQNFDTVLEKNREKLSKLLIWGDASKIRQSTEKWFDAQPVFENGRITILKRR
jgi:hypothetical protein